ncbi:MAG: ShlB/FhaC/HecB family hemolysin secretion/activation protein [Sideroxydans sp.]|nr:ShlB/FhaC/HecB family hemolysin secretion/activation protein [Sideroxydans sp.]
MPVQATDSLQQATLPVMTSLLAAVLLALPGMAVAATTPDAGNLLQQVQPQKAPAPSGDETGLRHKEEKPGKIESVVTFEVRQIRITGNTLFDTATLHGLVMGAEGKTLNFAQLQQLAQTITDYYHAHGYSMSRAVLPAQTVKNGVVNIEVLEARFGKINLNNHSRVNDRLVQDTLSPLKGGQIITDRDMEHSLLLLSDMPGAKAVAALKPGKAVGTADMDVDIAATSRFTGQASLDNYGNAYTGRTRLNAGFSVAEPFGHGDEFTADVLTTGNDMNYGRTGYDTLLNGYGTRLGMAYSALRYNLGGSLASLLGHGTATVSSLWVRHPFIRSRASNISAQLQFDHKLLRDHVDSTGIRTDRHLDNWVATLSGDMRDGMQGYNAWNLSLTAGRNAFDDPIATVSDAATAQTAGSYSKWNAGYARLQGLSPRNSLYLSLSGQWSSKNLDSAEKMIAGSPYTVRAYDMGVLSGDSGYQGTLEFRHRLSTQWQAKAFVDSEHITVNHSPWAAGTNSATLNGAGFGLDWDMNAWYARAYVAGRLGSLPALITSAPSAHSWVEFGTRF